jgi:hypothetical protein
MNSIYILSLISFSEVKQLYNCSSFSSLNLCSCDAAVLFVFILPVLPHFVLWNLMLYFVLFLKPLFLLSRVQQCIILRASLTFASLTYCTRVQTRVTCSQFFHCKICDWQKFNIEHFAYRSTYQLIYMEASLRVTHSSIMIPYIEKNTKDRSPAAVLNMTLSWIWRQLTTERLLFAVLPTG